MDTGWIAIAASLGFPAAVTAFILWRVEKVLTEVRDVMIKQGAVLDEILRQVHAPRR